MGTGARQNDDILHNYTVAKITMDCDFNPIQQPKYRIVEDVLDEDGNLVWEAIPNEVEDAYQLR